jgi:hypothetical protein
MTRLSSIPVAALAASLSLWSAEALATGQPEATPTGKGIVGGVLLGAEVVLLVEAAIDIGPAWAYIVGGAAGGIGGGIGGYYLEKTGEPKPAMFLLAGGMALAIPTTVAVLNATAYEPPATYTEDRGPVDEPVAEPPRPESRTEPGPRSQRLPPLALLGLAPRRLALSVPAIEVRALYTPVQLHEFGLEQGTEITVPVFSWLF